MEAGTVTVTDWLPLTAGAVKGTTSPLLRWIGEVLGG